MPESAAIIGVVVAVVTVLLVVSVLAVTVLIAWKLRSSEGHNLSNPFHKRRGMYNNSYYACVINGDNSSSTIEIEISFWADLQSC